MFRVPSVTGLRGPLRGWPGGDGGRRRDKASAAGLRGRRPLALLMGDPRRECSRVATLTRAAVAELSAPAGAGPMDGGERGRGVDGLGDGGAGARGRGAGARGRGAGARGRHRVWSPVLGDGAVSGARCSGTASGRWTAPGFGDWARRV